MHPIWLVLLLVIVGPIVGRAYGRRRRQTYEFTQLARRCGLSFAAIDLIGLHERYHNLELIRQGHNRYAWNVLYGATEPGLVAIFRYSYDLGFGVHQNRKQLWLAVLERPQPLASWKAGPPPRAEEPPQPDFAFCLGPFIVEADRCETLEALRQPILTAALVSMPENWHIESRGGLIAVAAPFDGDVATPGRLLEALVGLAKAINSGEVQMLRPE